MEIAIGFNSEEAANGQNEMTYENMFKNRDILWKINFHINQAKTHPCFHLKVFLKCTIEACNCNVVHRNSYSVLVTEPSLP